jgi:hypothetical protein
MHLTLCPSLTAADAMLFVRHSSEARGHLSANLHPVGRRDGLGIMPLIGRNLFSLSPSALGREPKSPMV